MLPHAHLWVHMSLHPEQCLAQLIIKTISLVDRREGRHTRAGRMAAQGYLILICKEMCI
jgi:hypothetical protein